MVAQDYEGDMTAGMNDLGAQTSRAYMASWSALGARERCRAQGKAETEIEAERNRARQNERKEESERASQGERENGREWSRE